MGEMSLPSSLWYSAPMSSQCPVRRRRSRHPDVFLVRHVRRQRRRRSFLGCSAGRNLQGADATLRGSYDPIWTAQAEGRFLRGALLSPSRQPIMTVARLFVVVALLSWAISPALAMGKALGLQQIPIWPALLLIALLFGIWRLTVGSRSRRNR